jgi:hypothetical protein
LTSDSLSASSAWLDTTAGFMEQDTQSHGARGKYWAQLTKHKLTEEFLTCLTGYFWLSAAQSLEPYQTVLVDPLLISLLYSSEPGEDKVTQVPARFFWRRRELWESMKPKKALLAFANDILIEGEPALWYLLSVLVQHDTVLLLAHVPHGSSSALVHTAATSLVELLCPSFPFQVETPFNFTISFLDINCSENNMDTTLCSALASLHVLCDRLLAQDTGPPHIPTMYNSLSQFFKRTMRQPDLTPKMPWVGLCHENGRLYGHQEYQDRPEWRLYSPNDSTSVESGYTRVYGNRQPEPVLDDNAATLRDFFQELQRTEPRNPEDLLCNVSGRSFDDLEEAILLSPSLLEKVPALEEGHPEACAPEEFVSMFDAAGGPKTTTNSLRILTGITPDNKNLRFDWGKGALHLEEDWLLPSSDIDSLSFTVRDPELSMQASVYAYPDRGMSMSMSNDLTVRIGNGQRIPMHQCMRFD